MVTCTVCLVVLVPLLAIAVLYGLQPVHLEFEYKTKVRASVEKTFNHLKDPEKLKDLIPNVVEVKVLEHDASMLDETDGIFKEYYLVNVVQDVPHRSGFTYNFTRKASMDQKTIESEGEMMSIITYQSHHSVEALKDGSVEIREKCQIQLPRALSWLIGRDVKENHQKINTKIKEELEKGVKVGQGTQTN